MSIIDQPEIRVILTHVVHSLTSDFHLREDLLQDAFIHLWKEETQHPGHTNSWYIDGCRHFLRNQHRLGKSIDSPKRGDHARLFEDAPEDTPQDDALVAASFLPKLIAHDASEQLSHGLTALRQRILSLFGDGFTSKEIALELGITPRAVNQNCCVVQN